MIRKISIACLITVLAGCATSRTGAPDPDRIIASDETVQNPRYLPDYGECHRYATANEVSVGKTAIGGAAAGAGLAALMGWAVGLDSGYGRLAGVGALSGGLSAAGGAAAHNNSRYREVMLQCLRDKGHQVY